MTNQSYRNEHIEGLMAFYAEKGIGISEADEALFASYRDTIQQ